MDNPIHICILTSAHPVDDVRVSHKIGQAFRSRGFRVTWVGPDHAFFDAQNYDRYGIEYCLFPARKGKLGRILGFYNAYRKGLLVSNVHVFYAPDPDSAAVAVRLAKKSNARMIFDIHEIFHDVMLDRWLRGSAVKIAKSLFRNWILNICSNCDLVIGVSRSVLEPYWSALTEKMVVRSCAPAWFAKDPPADVCGTGRTTFTFFHGKANLSRGTGVVLKALEHTKRLLPDIQCIMFDTFSGSANEISAFQQQVTELSLGQEVDLREGIPMQQMPIVLRECDAGLIAYGRELGVDSLPNKLFEYMAAGLPIIAPTYSPEICRIVEGERCGLTADFEDPQSVANAMLSLCQNPNRTREMGRNSRNAFEQRHNWEIEVHPLIDRIQSWFLMQEASQ